MFHSKGVFHRLCILAVKRSQIIINRIAFVALNIWKTGIEQPSMDSDSEDEDDEDERELFAQLTRAPSDDEDEPEDRETTAQKSIKSCYGG